jgi:phage/plasmid-associated DNA primase
LILLEFENVFEDNKDTTLIDKLTTEEEMSGLLNLALQNLRQLIRDNKFAYTKDIETVRRMYEENSNTMARFVQERIEALGANSQELVICRDAYGDYLDLCQTLGKKCKTDAQLGAYLTMALAGKWGGRQKKRINGVQEHVYYGIKLKQREQAMEPKA